MFNIFIIFTIYLFVNLFTFDYTFSLFVRPSLKNIRNLNNLNPNYISESNVSSFNYHTKNVLKFLKYSHLSNYFLCHSVLKICRNNNSFFDQKFNLYFISHLHTKLNLDPPTNCSFFKNLPVKCTNIFKNDFVLFSGPIIPKSLIHDGLIPGLKNIDDSQLILLNEEDDHRLYDEDEPIHDSDEEIIEEPEEDSLVDSEDSIKAKELWNKYCHIFKPLETQEEKEERFLKLPVTKINVEGVEIEVRMGTPGLPWFIDRENIKKLYSLFDPDVLYHALLKLSKSPDFPLSNPENKNKWVVLPGIPATYLPNIKVLDHKFNIPDYEFVTLLHDSGRNYTWTYQKSTEERAKSFDGDSKLDTYSIENGKIVPDVKKSQQKYKPFIPQNYFSVQEDYTEFYPRKTLDVGIFRQPKMDVLLNMKFKTLYTEDIKEGNFGYQRDEQNFWPTADYRDNGNKPGMAYRALGDTGIKISQVGLGTMFFGSTLDESQSHELLDYAYDKFGVNFFDTCEIYPIPFSFTRFGLSERILGNWIKNRGPDVRSNIVVSSRIVCRNDNLKLIRNSRDTSLSKQNIINAVNSSLERLGLDYIDLLQFSWPDRYVPMQENGDYNQLFFDIEYMNKHVPVGMEEQLEAIDELLKQGKIKAWGLSNETPWGLLRFYHLAKEMNVPGPSTIQLNYNLLCRNEVEKGFVELVRPQNTGIIAYGPLAGGILTGKYLEYIESTTSGRLLRFPSYMKRYRGSLAARAVKEYNDVAVKLGLPNLSVMSLKWVYSRPFIFSTIIGASDLYQLRENLHCLDPDLQITDLMERQINQIHWKWRDPLRIVQ